MALTEQLVSYRSSILKPGAVTCPLCEQSGTAIEEKLSELLNLVETDRRIVSCRHCGFRFMQPFLSDVEVEELYNTESAYFESYVSGPYLEIAREKLNYCRHVQEVIETTLKRKGRILDVGSATGHFLSIFKQNGWNVLGLELSDWCREYCSKQFGIDSIKGTAGNAQFPDEQFDVVTINHVLEHLDCPLAILRKIRRWLRPDGLLCVEVPNEFNDLVFTLANDWGRRRMYNDTKPILHHQLFFRPRHLRAAMLASGWTVLETRTSNWRAPVPCHLFRSKGLRSLACIVRKTMLTFGSLVEKGEFIFCLGVKRGMPFASDR